MKKFNLLLTSIVVLFLGSTILNAQNGRDPWAIMVGAHAVDYKGMHKKKDFFKTKNYSIVPPLSKLSIIRNLNRSFDVDLTGSVGEIDNDVLGVKDEFFINAGLGIRYKLANGYIFGENSWFDPYLRVGANYHRYDYTGVKDNPTTPLAQTMVSEGKSLYKDYFGVAGGGGINFWFTKNFGLNIASDYNWIPEVKKQRINFFQHTAGLTFRFGNNDKDGDGIPDSEDACPDTPGLPSADPECNGCPDPDGDGICDAKDECPEEAGLVENGGCPILDRDGDGILDAYDACPDTPGVASSDSECNGCPDTDGDGVCDAKDKCPNTVGLVENGGCPKEEKVITVEDSRKIKDALQKVLFEYNSDKLTEGSKTTLADVASILASPAGKSTYWLVEGHTDGKGGQPYNLTLSEKRAASVREYLISKGVNPTHVKSVGYGKLLPVTTNMTDDGRARNRRVELKYADENFAPAAMKLDAKGAQLEINDLSRFIYFETAKFTLIESSKNSLDVIASYLKMTGESYEVQGHTDNVGNDANNLVLSQKRAQSVVDYLILKGVPEGKVTAKGYGASNPKFNNATADGKAQNRRIEIVQQ